MWVVDVLVFKQFKKGKISFICIIRSEINSITVSSPFNILIGGLVATDNPSVKIRA